MFVRLGKLLLDGRTDNIADRLCFRWSPIILITCVMSILTYWLLGSPMVCHTPAQFSPQWRKYADAACWMNTNLHDVEKELRTREDMEIAVKLNNVTRQLHRWLKPSQKDESRKSIKIPSLSVDKKTQTASFQGISVDIDNKVNFQDYKDVARRYKEGIIRVSGNKMRLNGLQMDVFANSLSYVGGSPVLEMPSEQTTKNKFEERMTTAKNLNKKRYHLWVPFLLLVMAVLFTIPNIVWRLYIAGSDIKLDNLSAIFRSPKMNEEKRRERRDDREKLSKTSTNSCVTACRSLYSCVISVLLPRHDVVLVLAYFVIKILNLLLVNGQIFIMDSFMADMGDQRTDVQGLFHDLINPPRETTDSTIDAFPTTVMCEYNVRLLNNLLLYRISCILNANHLNPVILTLVSGWLNLLYLVVLVDLILWAIRLVAVTMGTVLFSCSGGNQGNQYGVDGVETMGLTKEV